MRICHCIWNEKRTWEFEMDPDRRIKAVIRGFMSLAGIIGNSWLCLSSLPKSRSQLRTSDILFVNLAGSNMITNYIVDILNIFHTERFIPAGKVFCAIRFFLPEVSETSSILSTTFITMYWHQKLVGSLKRGGAPVQMDSLRVITMVLICSWSFSVCFHLPHLFFVADDGGNVTAVECREELPSWEAEQAYELLYITLVNVIPLSGILYASIQITITLLQNKKRIKTIGTEVRNGGKVSAERSGDSAINISTVTKSKSQAKSGSVVRAAKSVVAVAMVFLICWIIHINVRILSYVSPTDVIEDTESFIGASYTCIIPYIYLFGAQKLTCSRRAGRVIGREREVS